MITTASASSHESRTESTCDLTLVIPAYNEAARLSATLATVLRFFAHWDESWEVIVADDGSQDATTAIAAAATRDPRVRLLQLPHRGKAATVRAGIAAAGGRYVIFTDADLSTPIEYVEHMRRMLADRYDLVIGTREGVGARRIGEPIHRHLMGRLFNYAVRLLAVPGVPDTQCGFKGFRAEVARDLFNRSQVYGTDAREVRGPLVTAFDVELLYLARKRRYRLAQLPVIWQHVEGSKVRPGLDALLMLRDVLAIRHNDLRGHYGRFGQDNRARGSRHAGYIRRRRFFARIATPVVPHLDP